MKRLSNQLTRLYHSLHLSVIASIGFVLFVILVAGEHEFVNQKDSNVLRVNYITGTMLYCSPTAKDEQACPIFFSL